MNGREYFVAGSFPVIFVLLLDKVTCLLIWFGQSCFYWSHQWYGRLLKNFQYHLVCGRSNVNWEGFARSTQVL